MVWPTAGICTILEQLHRPVLTDPQVSLRKHLQVEQETTLQVKRGVRRRPESTYAQESAVAVQTKSSWVSWWRPEANSARNVPRCPQRKRVNLCLDRVHRISQSEPPICNRLTCAGGHGGPPLRRGIVSANAIDQRSQTSLIRGAGWNVEWA